MQNWPFLNEFFHSLIAHIDIRDMWLLLVGPVFLLPIFLEAWHMRRSGQNQNQHMPDSIASIGLGASYLLADVILLYVMVIPAMLWVYQFRWFTIEITPLSYLCLYIGVDFFYYWYHRASHRVRFFWCSHVTHHSSNYYHFATALRQNGLYGISGNWLFFLPLVIIGFDPKLVMFTYAINLTYQFFIHTHLIKRLPAPIEFIFNTASHHRVHHGRNPLYLDKNYGGTLIIFDRLFGTFEPEVEKPDFGLVHRVYSNNIIWLTFHEWMAMIRDIVRCNSWSMRLKILWAPPGWEAPTKSKYEMG